MIAAYNEVYSGFDAIIPISARTGDGLDELLEQLQNTRKRGRSCSPMA